MQDDDDLFDAACMFFGPCFFIIMHGTLARFSLSVRDSPTSPQYDIHRERRERRRRSDSNHTEFVCMYISYMYVYVSARQGAIMFGGGTGVVVVVE